MNTKPTPEVTVGGMTFFADMAEISGFGGSYEEGCRRMVLAGLHWLEQHEGAKVLVGEFPGIIGIDYNANVYAEHLERAMLDAPYLTDCVPRTSGWLPNATD